MNQNKTAKNPDVAEDIDLFNFNLSRYKTYLPVFLVCSLITGTLAFIYYKWTPKRYEITATVLINDQRKGTDDAKMLEALDVFKDKKIVENEIEILASKSLLSQVVTNLGLYAAVTKVENYNKISLYKYSPIRIRCKELEKLVPAEEVPFTFNTQKRTVVIQGKDYPLNTWVSTDWGELIFLSNKTYIEPVAPEQYFMTLNPVRRVVEGIGDKLQISTLNRLASVITIKIEDTDPNRGEDILNELMLEYGKAEVQEKNVLAGNILESVENRLRYVSGQLDSVENVIQRFRSSAGVYDISEQGRLYLSNIGQFDKEVQDMDIRLSVLDEVEKYIQSRNLTASMEPIGVAVEDPALKKYLDDLNDAQLEYNRLKKTTAENSPIMLNSKDKIERLKPAILDFVKNTRVSLSISKRNLTNTSSRYSTMLNAIPQKEKQLIEISRQQSIKNEIYSYLLQRREEAALSYAAAKPDSRIVDAAQASVLPVKPTLWKALIPALLAGFLIPFILIFLRDTYHPTTLFREDIQKNLTKEIPIISEVFYDRKARAFAKDESTGTKPSLEQFRVIRNWLFFNLPTDQHGGKIVQITSTTRGEGKAFVCINLAKTLAAAGKKTLILDINNSSVTGIAKSFHISDKEGLTEYFSSNAKLNDIIYATDIDPNLSVIPPGTGDLANIEFFRQNKISDLFNSLKERFDYIIINSAPFIGKANTIAISSLSDQCIVVLRHHTTSKEILSIPADSSGLASLKSPVIVFNGIRRKGFFGKGYGHGVGYGYEIKGASWQ